MKKKPSDKKLPDSSGVSAQPPCRPGPGSRVYSHGVGLLAVRVLIVGNLDLGPDLGGNLVGFDGEEGECLNGKGL